MLSYTPKEPGTHELTIKVAIEGEEDSVQTFQCTIEATQADWKVEGAVDATGELTIQIEDLPEALRGERWHITETAWSKGLQGNIVHDPPGLTHGDNNLQVALNHIDLEAAPALHLTIGSTADNRPHRGLPQTAKFKTQQTSATNSERA